MKYSDYVNTKYKPKKDDLVCEFSFESKKDMKEAAGAIASESSIGTWTETSTIKKYMMKLAANVYDLKKTGKNSAICKIAYPNELWELNNMPGILSGIAGNIFGMKEVEALKLVDVHFTKNITHSFPGPKYGIEGIRKIVKVKNRPLIGTIVKPKIGLNPKDHANVAYQAWLGGCDIVKDDENLVDQKFNRFENRLKETLKLKWKAEKETGEKKIYMINVTAETQDMLKRAKLVQDYGNEYQMVDILTVGWAGLQTLRNKNYNLVIHGHRAGHAALDRVKNHGISMKVIAKLSRIIGCDQLHIGTSVGKMFETRDEVMDNAYALQAVTQEMHGIKKTMPVASGGLHPGNIPALYKLFGNDVIMQMGGGIHWNPLGTKYGAMGARQALEATIKGIPLEEYAVHHKALQQALIYFRKK
ncbi:MAG: type III ribulose-bisphosphate carboxylase [Candidatus Nanoarchaeia archaeon]|nr:type III ribulose-bisphosphate carboxylase [Candidatus Nanoarchaeia archaeon]MDD5587647.1 type III ribulose-bisphosphate carboxylase [Candidatus Nanoarchaeia archaeon]